MTITGLWDKPNGFCGQCGAPINACMVGGYKLHDSEHAVSWACNATDEQIKAAITASEENTEALKKRLALRVAIDGLDGETEGQLRGETGRGTVQLLIAAYDEYITLLGDHEMLMVGIAFAHGFRTPQAMVTRGEELCAEIEKLKGELPNA